MQVRHSLRRLASLGLGIGTVVGLAQIPSPAIAQGFDQTEVADPSQIILMTSPAGQVGHQLMIVEQLTDERPCWDESAGTVQPLLMDFDFSGICRRILDSNGYSLRMGNEDLGLDYSLRVIPEGDHLALVASSTKDFFAPSIEVGRTAPGQTSGFITIYLAPGWRLTRRSFEGQTLGHYYITNDMDIDAYTSIAVLSGDVLLAPSSYTFPSTPTPAPVTPPMPESEAPVPPSVPPNSAPSLDPMPDLVPDELTTPAPNTTVVPTISAPPPAPVPPAPIIAPQPNSPIPAVEAAPVIIPPADSTPEDVPSPLLVPSPPPLSTDTAPEDNASTAPAESPSTWLEFERPSSDVQTF